MNNIKKEDFILVQDNSKIYDVKLSTKPTTFFKDALKRFSKNKSSIIAGCILGFFILLAIFVPIFSRGNITVANGQLAFIEPRIPGLEKLGIFDGNKKYKNILYNYDLKMPVGNGKEFDLKYIVGDIKVHETKSNSASPYAKGGEILFTQHRVGSDASFYTSYRTIDLNSNASISFTTLDAKKTGINAEFDYYLLIKNNNEEVAEVLISSTINRDFDVQFYLDNYIRNCSIFDNSISTYSVAVKYIIPAQKNSKTSFIKISKFILSSNNNTIYEMDANKVKLASTADPEFWTIISGSLILQNTTLYRCDFTIDTYARAFDSKELEVSEDLFMQWYREGKFEFNMETKDVSTFRNVSSPINKLISYEDYYIPDATGGQMLHIVQINADVCYYKYLGYDEIPYYYFGTDNNGYDLFKRLWAGFMTSLLLGITVTFINIFIGLIWGAISGYYGGSIDLVLQRMTEILSGIPQIVIITLCILHRGQSFGVFVFALVISGWIGTASRTRSQFYRYKGREFVLASRTLGAKDNRLIFRHILPNAIGPIITSGVLMIPGVIFTEASLAYLGLGFTNLNSIGVILAGNQAYIMTHAYLIAFSSLVVAIIMVCFNLFGNGLRDAFNPSLKGIE